MWPGVRAYPSASTGQPPPPPHCCPLPCAIACRQIHSMSAPAIAAVATPNAPAALGPYSQAVSYSGPTLYVSGQIPLHPETMAVVGETAADQARQALKNMGAILEAGGSSPQRVLKVTVMLAEIADFAAVNEVYAEFFGDHKPARACFACKSLPKGVLIEVDCIAAVP